MFLAIILLSSLAVFWGVSLVNVIQHKGTETGREADENPLSPAFTLALIGTVLMFAEAFVFSYLHIARISRTLVGQLFTPTRAVSYFGVGLFLLGTFLHSWSVRARGKYATSWEMSTDHKVITVAPYSIVRHPSYLGYMLMIIGMTLVWGNVVTLIPWIAIPGYYFVSLYEEAMLIERFGEEYLTYMKKVRGFIPRI